MNITNEITRLEKSSVNLSVTIGKEDVNSEYNELISTYLKSAQLPGFRKGKVPRDVIIRKFGDALKGEVLGKIISKAMETIFEGDLIPKEDKPLPYSTPSLKEEPNLDLENDLRFSVVYDVLPIVRVEKWQGLEVEVFDVSANEEDVKRELETIRERNSIVLDKNEGECAANGDVVTVNYSELDDSGRILANSEREDFTFTLGTGLNVFQFDDEIAGMNKGETKEFSKTFPEDHKDFPGRTKKLKVTLTAIKIKKLPDLDDDLAQDVDDKYKTLEDLKNHIRERLSNQVDQISRNLKINKILDKLMEATPVDIPESMLRAEMDSRWKNLARELNTSADGLYKMMGNSPEKAGSIIESWRPESVKALHSRLIINAIMEDLKLEVSEDEAKKEFEKFSLENMGGNEDAEKYYSSEGMKDFLIENVKERKFFDILLEKNIFKTGEKKNYIDMVSNYR